MRQSHTQELLEEKFKVSVLVYMDDILVIVTEKQSWVVAETCENSWWAVTQSQYKERTKND